jgi:hypothetical protein
LRLLKTSLAAIMLIALTGVISCTPELTDDPIPPAAFSSIYINLNLPAYNGLRTVGGYAYIGDGGVRGIILYHQAQFNYIAYERNCSYRPNEACATVDVDISTLFMHDPCCHSQFDFSTGMPTGGPAWRPLRKYETLLSGSDLTITDTVIE